MIGVGSSASSQSTGGVQSAAREVAGAAPSEEEDDPADQSMSLATGEQNQELSSDDTGMSLGSPSSRAQSSKETSDGKETSQSAKVLTFPFNVTTPKADFIKTTLGGGRFKVNLTAWYQVQGTIEFGSPSEGEGEADKKTAISLFGANAGKYAASIGQSWRDEEGVKIFDFETVFTDIDQKATFEANGKELEIAYEAAGTLACGTSVSIKAVLIGYEGGSKGETKVCAIALGANIPPFKPKDYPIPTVKGATARGIGLQAHVEGTLEPNWVKIAEDVAKKIAERVGAEAAFDAGIAGGLVIAAFGVIPASLHQLVEGDDVDGAGQAVNETTHALMDGYRLGVTGDQAPGDEIAQLGFKAGSQVFAQALATVKQSVPDVTDDVAKQWIGEWVAKNQLVEKAHDQFLDMAAEAAWDHYATKYSDSRMYQMTAFSNIYPEKKDKFTDPLFTKYVTAR